MPVPLVLLMLMLMLVLMLVLMLMLVLVLMLVLLVVLVSAARMYQARTGRCTCGHRTGSRQRGGCQSRKEMCA
jgi:hypothetical protein